MKEMKLLLDMYKGVGKEQRDKVQLMAAERKTRAELEDLRQQVKKIQVCCNIFYNYYNYYMIIYSNVHDDKSMK